MKDFCDLEELVAVFGCLNSDIKHESFDKVFEKDAMFASHFFDLAEALGEQDFKQAFDRLVNNESKVVTFERISDDSDKPYWAFVTSENLRTGFFEWIGENSTYPRITIRTQKEEVGNIIVTIRWEAHDSETPTVRITKSGINDTILLGNDNRHEFESNDDILFVQYANMWGGEEAKRGVRQDLEMFIQAIQKVREEIMNA